MLLPGTQMHIITFLFVCIEIVILFFLIIYKLARPDDNKSSLNICLVFLLLIYNITGGLLPDPNLPGSLFMQEVIAYATGFITPSYFPYYVYNAFGLKKMRFHAYRGVFIYLILPFFCFVAVYAITKSLKTAQYLLILPVLYAIWVIHSLAKAIRYKYNKDFSSRRSKEEIIVLFVSLTPWVSLPVIVYFDLPQALEVSVTNTGFLLLLSLQLKNNFSQLRKEHYRLMDSEIQLLNWNTDLQREVEKRTIEMERIYEQRANSFINLAHETKTPLTLIKNYLDEFSLKRHGSNELNIVRKSIDKLTADITNLLDIERFEKGLNVYNHDQISSFNEILNDNLLLFSDYAIKRSLKIESQIETDIFIKADPIALNRLVNNLLENSIKYSPEGKQIWVKLWKENDIVTFSVLDKGVGIPPEFHVKIFEPYFQINHIKKSSQGLGLGLPIVKKVIDSLNGTILIQSDPSNAPGTQITVILNAYELLGDDLVARHQLNNSELQEVEFTPFPEAFHDMSKQTILLVEDNFAMVHYLKLKLINRYNVYVAFNGSEAIERLGRKEFLPDLIISDIMMDIMDGYSLAQKVSQNIELNHIPFLFLSARSGKDDKLYGLKLGAIDFIGKPFSLPELEKKIESILANATNQKRAFLQSAVKALSSLEGVKDAGSNILNDGKFDRNCQLYGLTPREKTIARLILVGASYKKIGESLFIAERTVTTHVNNIFEKLNVSNKIELMNKLIA